MKTFTLLGSVLLASSAVLVVLQSQAPKPGLQDDEYAVYSLAIQTEFVKEGIERLVVGDHTLMHLPPVMLGMTQFGGSPEMQKIRETASKETLKDYEEKNKTSVLLDQEFSLSVPVSLITEAERDRIFTVTKKKGEKTGNPKGFEEFNRLFPKSPGFTVLSRVGFNPDKTEALLYIGNLCGGLCGSGQFFLLAKDGGGWKVRYSATTWVS